ncbi:MAG TPA: cell division protein FtsW, partial [Lacibacter sp.]|nr:cell division protein FtsW [Lacibacter sp.]
MNQFSNITSQLSPSGLKDKTRGDKVIWALVIVLSLISLLVVYSATNSLAYKMYKGNNAVYLFKQI